MVIDCRTQMGRDIRGLAVFLWCAVLCLLVLIYKPVFAQVPEKAGPEEVVTALMRAWNQRDAAAFAAQFTEDANFVNVNGWIWFGRQDIQNRHERSRVFHTVYTETKTKAVQLLAPDVALLHMAWRDTGDPRDPAPRDDLMTMVLVNRDGNWRIAAAQNGTAVNRAALPGTTRLVDSPIPPESANAITRPQIEKVFLEADERWNQNPTSMAELFTEDADFVDSLAQHVKGRRSIEQMLSAISASLLRQRTARTSVLLVKTLDSRITVAAIRTEFTDASSTSNPVTMTGLRVVVNQNERWRIRAAQDTIQRAQPRG
jgi:uncharacterized protein (TIGR02246 family)